MKGGKPRDDSCSQVRNPSHDSYSAKLISRVIFRPAYAVPGNSKFRLTISTDRHRVCLHDHVRLGELLMRTPGPLIAAALILAAASCFTACQRSPQNAPLVNRPLPPPPAGELKYAGTPPAHPFAKQTGNYYARTVFETDGPGNSHIEVREFLIPPRSTSSVAALPGSAVMDPATGKATVSIGDKPEKLDVDAMRSLPAGQALQFENPDSRPAMIRLYVIRGR